MVDTDKIFKEIIGQGNSPGITDMVTKLKQVDLMLEAMDDVVMRLHKGLQAIGQGLDICNFKVHMVMEILTDKGVVSEEELNGHYKQVVQDKLTEMRRIQEEKMQEAMAQVEQQAGIKTRTIEVPEEPKAEEPEKYTGNVKLASEKNEPVKF
jgi:hypothetical protein